MSGYTTVSLRSVIGPTVITAPTAATTALTIVGQSGQASPYLNITRNSNGQPALQVSDGTTLTNNTWLFTNPIRNNAATLTLGATTDFGVLLLGSAGNPIVMVRGAASQTSDLERWQSSTPTTLTAIDKIGRLTFPNVEAVTASAGAAAGTSPPAPVPGGNDMRGYATFGTGTGPSAGIMCSITFATAFAAAPVPVISPTNAATAALGLYALNFSTTGFDVAFNSAPAASQANTTYGFSFAVLG